MKISLIIDGNYLMHRVIFPLIEAKTLYGEFYSAMSTTLNKQIEMYPFDQIWFVSDDRFSWRKTVQQDYKGNRTKDDKIDWEFIYNTYDEFKQKLDPNRFIMLQSPGIEGDDWIAEIVRRSNQKGISTLMFTSDTDLNQMLKWSLNPSYINIQYKDHLNNQKAYFPEGYQIFINQIRKTEIDLFEMDWRKDFIELMDTFTRNYTIEEIDDEQHLFKKLLMGDKKDNVKAVYYSMTKTGKPIGIGDSGANKIWTSFREINPDIFDFESSEFADDITTLVCEYKKAEDTPENKSLITKNLKRNLEMLNLKRSYIPAEFADDMNKILKLHF
jgi:hypothetical protein